MDSPRVSLAGEWTCALDRGDVGVTERWFGNAFKGIRAELPGSLAAQRIGELVTLTAPWTGTIFDRSFFDDPRFTEYRKPGKIKIPFWLQPETIFVGAAWFTREIVLPENWAGKRLVVSLERPHWETRLWIDGREVGSGESLSVPHRFDLGSTLESGKHQLTIRVDNRLRVAVGENAHSVSDHTQGNWNGIVGEIELTATAATWIAEFQVFPLVDVRAVRLEGKISSQDITSFEGWRVRLSIDPVGTNPGPFRVVSVEVEAGGGFSAQIELGVDAAFWDEFSPALYRAKVMLPDGETKSVVFGLREITTRGRELRLNGRKLFLRGSLDCCAFPKTGHPPMLREEWLRALRVYQSHGLNHVRFHSWCPPKAAFAAADELGLYLQVECATWANAVAVLAFNSPAGLGDGDEIDDWLYRETDRILREYGNHPSFLLLSSGNEPGGPKHPDYLRKWVRHFLTSDSRRLYTGAAGWPELAENQFEVIPAPRGHQWGDGLKSRFNGQPPATTADYREEVEKRVAPIVSHEIGQWTAYPPLHDSEKYTGHLKAKNYEIFRDSLEAARLGHQLDNFVQASGKLQALLYKEEIESSLRTPGLGGFQLLGLHDFPGQGTAPVGVVDVFGESKGYITAEEFRRFCSPTVLLARMERRVFQLGDVFSATIEVAHFGQSSLHKARVLWKLCDLSEKSWFSGELYSSLIEAGQLSQWGKIEFAWRQLPAPARYKLDVEIEGTEIRNDWDLWLYPESGDAKNQDHPCIATRFDLAISRASSGERVLLLIDPKEVVSDVALGFSTIFWNTWCTQRQAPHTLGILCDPSHPALALFPTESHTNWQWWYLLQSAAAMPLKDLPADLTSIVQVIDDWFTNRRLALAFEAKVGTGRLLVCSVGCRQSTDPVSRQFLESLVAYVTGERFDPATAVNSKDLASIFRSI